MRRLPLLAVAVLTLFVSACRDAITPPTSALKSSNITASATCIAPSLSDLLQLAETAYGAGSPNYNSVRGKIENLDHQLNNVGNRPAAVERAHDIVDFTLTKNTESPLPGGSDAVAAFATAVYCFADIAITVTDPDNSALIFPLDEPQIIYNADQTVGISFPGDPVFDPSLIVIEENETSQLGALTKLDRYPGYIRITQLNENGTKLKFNATVAVCAFDVPEEIFDDLRLGHGLGDVTFVITPRPMDGDPVEPTLQCEAPAPELRLSQRLFNKAAEFLAPSLLHANSAAALELRRGGVSGTVSEFSPFEPVDTKLRAGGGVSGTVSEFLRAPMAMLQADGGMQSMLSPTCASLPLGAELPSECLPMVTITTRTLGTVLENVPVDWTIPDVSGGMIAAADGNGLNVTCDTFGRSVNDLTSAAGTSAVCWRIGGVGTYSVTARPRVGGDAPEGVTFVDDADGQNPDGLDFVDFTLTVEPVTISIASPNPESAAPGSVLSPRVRVLMGTEPAAGVRVDWTALANSDASVTPSSSLTDGEGYAWTNWTIGAGYNELRAKVRNGGDDDAVTFSATGLSAVAWENSCPVGGSRDPINDPSKPFAFWVPGPSNGAVMREVDLYFGASGKANRPSDYQIGLVTRRSNGFLSLFADTTIVTVELRGSASENKLATFRLNTPIIGSAGNSSSNANAVAMQLIVLTNPDNATVNFNTGPCPLGNCKVPRGCAATEINLNTVTGSNPLGETYRRSVGISIRGN
jgi:hypothetical protein